MVRNDDISIYRYRTGTGNKFNLIRRMTVHLVLGLHAAYEEHRGRILGLSPYPDTQEPVVTLTLNAKSCTAISRFLCDQNPGIEPEMKSSTYDFTIGVYGETICHMSDLVAISFLST